MFFSNPPQSRASTYCTLAQVYNLHREFAESEKKHSLQTAGVHRELRQLRAALSSAVAAMRPADEAAGAREGLQPAPAGAPEGLQPEPDELARACARDIQSMKEAVAGVSQQLAVLLAMLAAQPAGAPEGLQPAPARARERRGSDASDGSTEVLHAGDCVDDPS
jgi:hypothetical protein